MGKYIDQYKELHKLKRYGVSGDHLVQDLKKYISKDITSILDFGCGQSNTVDLLRKELGLEAGSTRGYDPAVPGKDSDITKSYDLVLCTDVLEHIPEEELNEVLVTIWDTMDKEAIFVIALREAAQVLPNGENAHCTVYPKGWWEKKLRDVFSNVVYITSPSKPYWTAWFKCTKSPETS